MNQRTYITALLAFSFVLTLFTPIIAQQPKSEAEIRKLLAKSRSKDLKVSDEANEQLSKLDSSSVPALVGILKKGNSCERVRAAGYINEFDPKNPNVIPAMTKLISESSLKVLFNLQEEMMCRRAAGQVLALSADGIKELKQLLKDGDDWERETAIFALDDLTETANYPEGSLPVMTELIPEIGRATKAKNEVLSGMADEVLGQIARGPNTELSELVKKYIK